MKEKDLAAVVHIALLSCKALRVAQSSCLHVCKTEFSHQLAVWILGLNFDTGILALATSRISQAISHLHVGHQQPHLYAARNSACTSCPLIRGLYVRPRRHLSCPVSGI